MDEQFQAAVRAAQEAGAVYPEVVAEYLRPDLTTVSTQAGPTVMSRNGLGFEPLSAVIARLKVDAEMGAAMNGGRPDLEHITTRVYRAFRRHAPEVLGLR
jgi:hypothetical protein